MKKINSILRKCKSLSRQLARSSSYSNLRSKSSRQDFWVSHDHCDQQHDQQDEYDQKSATIFVGSAKKRYVISTKYLSHPLLEALIDKSRQKGPSGDNNNIQDHINNNNNNNVLVVKCEVVLFDHLLWMLENADPVSLGSESLEELAALYVF